MPKGKVPVKKRAPKSQSPTQLETALKALKGKRYFQFVGGMDKDGNANINLNELEELKKKLKAEGIDPGKVRFVALNAPFMRRSPTT